jgi:hypothetical protein
LQLLWDGTSWVLSSSTVNLLGGPIYHIFHRFNVTGDGTCGG